MKPLEAAFDRAAKLGATGQWYAGEYFSGRIATLRGGKTDAQKVKNAPEPIKGWINEAYDYSGLCAKGKAPPRTRLAPAPESAKRAAPAKKRATKVSRTKSKARKPKR